MIRIDGEKGEKGEFAVNSFFIYPYDADVVLHPRQSLDSSSRGTTSPEPAGHSAASTWCFTPTNAMILRRGAPRRPRPAGHRLVRRGASPPPKS